jgi:hypothetical protein
VGEPFLDCPAQPHPVSDRGVCVRVHHSEAVRSEESLDRADVGLVAGGEHQRVVTAEPAGDLVFERDVQAIGAVEQTTARRAGTELLGRPHRGGDHIGMRRQADVGIRTEQDTLAAPDADPGWVDRVDLLEERHLPDGREVPRHRDPLADVFCDVAGYRKRFAIHAISAPCRCG